MSSRAQSAYEHAHSLNERNELDAHAANTMLTEHYRMLQSNFPDSVKHVEENYLTESGDKRQQVILRIGEPMRADAVFGRLRSLEVCGELPRPHARTIKGDINPTIVTNKYRLQGVHEQVDARQLHYPDASFSAFVVMHPPGYMRENDPDPDFADFRPRMLQEAYRVLEPGGHILFAGATTDDLTDMLRIGFKFGVEDGCIDSWLSYDEKAAANQGYANPRMHMEILLQK